MSRSNRHSPFLSNTSHESEKADKRRAHQRERKWFHDHLTPQRAIDEDFDIAAYHEHPRSGRVGFAKHGKSFAGDASAALRK